VNLLVVNQYQTRLEEQESMKQKDNSHEQGDDERMKQSKRMANLKNLKKKKAVAK
jgi:hypothetical protein